MDIAQIRQIGDLLFREISGTQLASYSKSDMGKGAGGDKTYPIDRIAEDIILSGLSRLNEPLTIISEEAGVVDMNGGGLRVVIDPIDGSRNAISGIPFFCVSIAVADGDTLGDVYLSYVLNLVNRDEFWAERGSGAFMNGRRIETQKDDVFRLVAYEAQLPGRDIPVISPLLSAARKTRCLGATALDLAYLSLGAVSVFISPSPSRSFDFAGGWLLVNEAGGMMTDAEARDIRSVLLGLERSVSILASANRQLHRKAFDILSRGKDLV